MSSLLDLSAIPSSANLSSFGIQKNLSYHTIGEGRVDISGPINPWHVLDLHSSSVPLLEIKAAFKKKTTQTVRQERAMASIAYHMLTSSTDRYMRKPGTEQFVIRRPDHFTLAACGHTPKLTRMIRSSKTRNHLVKDKDEHQRNLLYIASRSGFFDTCELLLRNGAPINAVQSNGSTPLHGAAYFGHTLIVALLLQHGAKGDIKNKWGNTPLDESATPEIRRLIQTASTDSILSLTADLREKNLVWSVQLINYQGEVIAKELIRNHSALDKVTRAKWNDICNWDTAWHGTVSDVLESIMKKGLLPAGPCGINPPEGHIQLGQEFRGIKNWAGGIFLSPSILYASREEYSERLDSESQQWCVLVRAFCKPGCYEAYEHTLAEEYVLMAGEPKNVEYRVPVICDDLKVEFARNVVVHSLMFVQLSFLKNQGIVFNEKTMTLLRSQEKVSEEIYNYIDQFIYIDNFRQ